MSWHLSLALRERLIETVVACIRSQRPSLLNAATQAIADDPSLLCDEVPPPANGAPRVAVIDPLVIGESRSTRLLADYCYQIPSLKLDFFPGGSLTTEKFALSLGLSVGLGIPDRIDDSLLLLPDPQHSGPPRDVFLPYRDLKCFSIEVETTGSVRWVSRGTRHHLVFALEGIDFGGASGIPFGLLIEQLLLAFLNSSVLPGMALVIEKIAIDAPDDGPDIEIRLLPSGVSPNPTIRDNTLAAYLTLI